jgi:hypothetical protein
MTRRIKASDRSGDRGFTGYRSVEIAPRYLKQTTMMSHAIDPMTVRSSMSISSIEFDYRTDAATLPDPFLSDNAQGVGFG